MSQPTETTGIRDLIADSRSAVQRMDQAAAKVGQAADRIGQAADRVPSAEALAVAYWHGAVMGVCVALAVVCVVCACVAVWRGANNGNE